ncbi:MAG: ABC transporter permease, partial [Cyclobacteriaceae bacterium]
MLKNYFKVALRSLQKNKAYVIINILGMGVAIATCIVAYLNYDFNAKFDHYNEHIDEVYHVVTVRDYNNAEQPYGIVPFEFTELVSTQVSGVDNIARLIPEYVSIRVDEDEVLESNILFSDPAILEMFSFDIISGSGNVMNGKSILISESAAEKYFGQEDPLGR